MPWPIKAFMILISFYFPGRPRDSKDCLKVVMATCQGGHEVQCILGRVFSITSGHLPANYNPPISGVGNEPVSARGKIQLFCHCL